MFRDFSTTRNGSGFCLSLGFKRGKATLQFLKSLRCHLIVSTQAQLSADEISRDGLQFSELTRVLVDRRVLATDRHSETAKPEREYSDLHPRGYRP